MDNEIFKTPMEKFRNSVGFQFNFVQFSGLDIESAINNICKRAEELLKSTPVDMILFCPSCSTQHIDEAKPDNCQDCGHDNSEHFNAGERNVCGGGEWNGDIHDDNGCKCDGFKAWLNPPHRSHRCHFCNHVFRPADVPTNGVAELLKTFDQWFEELKKEVAKLPENHKSFFDLRETNLDCWREEFESSRTPAQSVEDNVDALLRSQ